MFKYSIDEKKTVVDYKGNNIKDLASSMFAKRAGNIMDYKVVKMSSFFHMRPDLVAKAMYEDQNYAEFILKYSGISNPFTLADDDVLMIPNDSQAEGMMAVNNVDESDSNKDSVATQIRNYFKFVNQEYKPDKSSYDALEKKDIPSGIIGQEDLGGTYMVPYISEDGRTAVTIRGARMYFGEDAGLRTAGSGRVTSNDVTKSVQSILDDAMTSLSDKNCIYNGASLIDFVRANINNNNANS